MWRMMPPSSAISVEKQWTGVAVDHLVLRLLRTLRRWHRVACGLGCLLGVGERQLTPERVTNLASDGA